MMTTTGAQRLPAGPEGGPMTEQEQTVILEAREILARYFNQNPLLTSWQAVLDYCAIAVHLVSAPR